MFGCNVSDARRISSFEEAENFFNHHAPFKGRAWDSWDTSAVRGLGNQRQPHYALRRISPDAYSVELYHTPLLTYHRPEHLTYKVEAYSSNHAASWAWLRRHASLQHGTRMTSTLEDSVLVPIGTDSRSPTVIVRTSDTHRVITNLSAHPQIYTRCSSPEDKSRRAELRSKLEVIVDLAMHTCVWTGTAKQRHEKKHPFKGMTPKNSLTWQTRHTLETEMLNMKDFEAYASDTLITAILDCANTAYNYYEEQPSITAFRKNYTSYLIRLAGADYQSGKKYYMDFPLYSDVPNKFSLESK